MKSLLLFVALLGAIAFASAPSAGTKTLTGRKQKATMQFTSPVLLQGVTLKGKYLFVHDDAAMTHGEACTRVYKGEFEDRDKLVVAFHCVPVERDKADYFTVRTNQISPDVVELTEFQFKGDTEAHAVPALK